MGSEMMSERRKGAHNSSKYKTSPGKGHRNHEDIGQPEENDHNNRSQRTSTKIDLRKEYNRYCKLYSSEPLDIVAGPLEKASYRMDSVELDLKGRGLRGVDCIALGKILASNVTIYHLNLSDCLLLPQGFQALLDGLGRNTFLQVLELRGNNIQSTMVENLSAFLKINQNLKQLLLEWNCLGSSKSSFQLFCDALCVNKGLEYVDLRNNQIADESGIELASVLKQNSTLKNIDLRWNSLGIQGAKAIWDSLQYNQSLTKLDLCGNFVPEEIVRHVETTLRQRGEKEALLEDYSKRTELLTSRLHRTEENYKTEIKSILHVFEDEEAGFKRMIHECRLQIEKLSQELLGEKETNEKLTIELHKLTKNLTSSSERENLLRESLEMKDEQIDKLENALKLQAGELGSRFESKITQVTQDLESIQEEHDKLGMRLQDALSTIKEKDSEISILSNRLESLKQSHKRTEELAEERLQKEKSNWLNWKAEVESNEHQETQRLQNQLQDIQKNMHDHTKVLETKRAEAEEEINRLKILLLTAKTEAEESCSHLRRCLTEEHATATQGLLAQIEGLKKSLETLETEGKRLDAIIRKLESEAGSLQRQNQHLKQQNTNLEQEIIDNREKCQETLAKTKNELKEFADVVNKEQEANKVLRGQVLETQEQVATLTMKLKRAEKELANEGEYWQTQISRRDEELKRLKEEDMRRAALLHDAFTVYMRSTSAATGLPIPSSSCPELHKALSARNNNPNLLTSKNKDGKGAGGDNNN